MDGPFLHVASNEWAIADVLIPKRVSEAGGNGERADRVHHTHSFP